MASQGGRVGEYRVITDYAIMGNMAICHEQIVGPYDGFANAVASTTVHSNKLANPVSIANLKRSPFAGKLQVLWNFT
jgi:hypothetical protein